MIGAETPFAEIYSIEDQEWSAYRDYPEHYRWNKIINCITVDGNVVYEMNEFEMIAFDLADWTMNRITINIPQDFFPDFVPKCAVTEFAQEKGCFAIDTFALRSNLIGLFLHNGYFFGFETLIWYPQSPPPIDEFFPSSLFQYEGKPTLFGVCKGCDPNWEYMVDILQYEPADNDWHKIGELLTPRFYHTVIEMPNSVCDSL